MMKIIINRISIYFASVVILLSIFCNYGFAQNAKIDTVKDYKLYVDFISGANYFVKLISENK